MMDHGIAYYLTLGPTIPGRDVRVWDSDCGCLSLCVCLCVYNYCLPRCDGDGQERVCESETKQKKSTEFQHPSSIVYIPHISINHMYIHPIGLLYSVPWQHAVGCGARPGLGPGFIINLLDITCYNCVYSCNIFSLARPTHRCTRNDIP